MTRRKICYITGSRADYGLLSPLIEKTKKNKKCITQIIVTGSHFSKRFGYSYKEIKKDNHNYKSVNILDSSTTNKSTAKSIAKAIVKISNVIEELNPDIIVVLGDRYEILAASIAGMILNIPIAHIHGGELSFGSFDEAIRHSITKMAHLHFTSAYVHQERVIRLGEDPKKVFNVGSLGVENIKRINFLNKKELEKKLKIIFNKKNLLLAFHPITLDNHNSLNTLKTILNVVSKLKNTNIFITKANADPMGDILNKELVNFVKNKKNIYLFGSLGIQIYLSLLNYVDGIIGNSSSGIIEAPSLKKGSIDIGIRQKGRLRASSVITCAPKRKDILSAISKLYSKKYNENLRSVKNPYYKRNTSDNILNILSKIDLKNITLKEFYE